MGRLGVAAVEDVDDVYAPETVDMSRRAGAGAGAGASACC